jgi:cation:H+ antiporter
MLDFSDFGLAMNMALFALSAGCVWQAGTRISTCAKAISDMTGMGQALLGLLLLGGVTSLPELAVSLSSAIAGNAALAVNNISAE